MKKARQQATGTAVAGSHAPEPTHCGRPAETAPRKWPRTFILEALFIAVALAFVAFGRGTESVRTLSLIFASIVLEAVPFMLIGAVAGGLLETFVSRDRMTALLPKRRWQTVLMAAGLGLIFPICECAVVPVVRRLTRKGFPLAAAVAYLLGGPIVNPIVGASTAVAYKLNWGVMGIRLVAGYAIAVGIGLLMDRIFRGRQVFVAGAGTGEACGCGHDHGHEDHDGREDVSGGHEIGHAGNCSCGCGHDHAHGAHGHDTGDHGHEHDHGQCPDHDHGHEHRHGDHNPETIVAKLTAALHHAADDFMAVGHYLIIGAFIAAVAQTYVDRSVFVQLSGIPVVSVLLMMVLAILLNLCSEADAFIASSFRQIMPLSAQMAFMLIGPMFDLKLLLMYQTLFRRRVIVVLAALIFAMVLAAALFIHYSGLSGLSGMTGPATRPALQGVAG